MPEKDEMDEQTQTGDSENMSIENKNVAELAGKSGEERIAEIKDSTEYKELYDKFLRLAAEFENYKKRTAKEYARVVDMASDSILREFLDVVDDFERAKTHAGSDADTLAQGLELIYSKLLELLSRHGVRQIDSIGKSFDPMYHEAIMQIESADKDDGSIVEEIQKGYSINNRVLRPARVIVTRKIPASYQEEDTGENPQTN